MAKTSRAIFIGVAAMALHNAAYAAAGGQISWEGGGWMSGWESECATTSAQALLQRLNRTPTLHCAAYKRVL